MLVIEFTSDDAKSRSTSYNSRRSTREVETERQKMKPMFLFLASSFNVELVYSILKGITQFGYITLCEPNSVQEKLTKMHIKVNEETTELTFFKIKIKNFNNWNATSY